MSIRSFLGIILVLLSTTLFAQEPQQQGGFYDKWSAFDKSRDKGLGLVTVPMSYSGTAIIRQVPAVGLHPRVYFNTSDTAAIFTRLRTTVSGKALYKNLRAYTILMNLGGKSYNRKASYALDGFGNPYIDNVGAFDVQLIIQRLIGEDATTLSAVSDRMRLGSTMSMEAFLCFMNHGKQDPEIGVSYDDRAMGLAKAMAFWAKLVLAETTTLPGTNIEFGGVNMAMAYDFNYWAMSPAQRDIVRQALVKTISKIPRYGPNLDAYATTSNWTALLAFDLLMNFAIEGETGYNPTFTNDYARTYHNFLTYGYLASGEGYEGTGKNYVFATTLVALAKRGYSLLGHPHLRAYATRYLNALAQPYRNGFIGSDLWGGHGYNPALGGYRFNGSDGVGLKYIYPEDPSVDFLWKTYINTSASLSSTGYVTQNFLSNDGAYNYLLLGAIFGLDYKPNTTAQEAHKNELDYFSKEGGLGAMRSDFTDQGMMALFYCRQNLGGHTYGNRNEFTLSALGRTWVQRVYGGDQGLAQTKFQNCILIDDKGIYSGILPAKQPAKVIGWQSSKSISSVTGDATYAYNWKWLWNGYPENGPPKELTQTPGWSKVSKTPNDFQLYPYDTRFYPFADSSYYNQPFELRPKTVGLPKLIIQFHENIVEKVRRTAALVRAAKPYLLIIDDVKKDQDKHRYKWHANIPSDLSIEKTDVNLTDQNYRCDLILKENTGNRRLLIRVLQNEGFDGKTAVGRMEPYEYTDETGMVFGRPSDLARQRLVIESNSVEPKFKVLLFPYTEGDPLPVTNFNPDHSRVQIVVGSDSRTFAFGEFKNGENTALVQTTADLAIKAYLQGAMLTTPNRLGYSTMMRDDLRAKNLLPTKDPYFSRPGFIQGTATEPTTTTTVLSVTGANAIVDWVFVELRSPTNTTLVVATQSGLLQRDGDVVSTDGVSPLRFEVEAGNYRVVLRHRNHLGVMSQNPIALSESATTGLDFTSPQTVVYGTNSRVVLPSTATALWAGDASANGRVELVSASTDVNTISQQVLTAAGNKGIYSASFNFQAYANADTDLNGVVEAIGNQADTFLISTNVLSNPLNISFSPSLPLRQQIP